MLGFDRFAVNWRFGLDKFLCITYNMDMCLPCSNQTWFLLAIVVIFFHVSLCKFFMLEGVHVSSNRKVSLISFVKAFLSFSPSALDTANSSKETVDLVFSFFSSSESWLSSTKGNFSHKSSILITLNQLWCCINHLTYDTPK